MTAETLTTEQARELAGRWVACTEHVGRWGAAKYWAEPRFDAPVHGPIRAEDHVTQRPIAMPCEPLAPADRERLFAWVRERMAEEDDRSPYATVYRHDLTVYICGLLGWDSRMHDEAHALCEAAGWPS